MITCSTNDGKIGYSGEVYYIAMISRSTNDGKIGYSGEVYYIAMITRSTNDGKIGYSGEVYYIAMITTDMIISREMGHFFFYFNTNLNKTFISQNHAQPNLTRRH